MEHSTNSKGPACLNEQISGPDLLLGAEWAVPTLGPASEN